MLFVSFVFLSNLLIFIFVCILFYLYFTRNFDYWKKKNVPFVKPVPIFGSFHKALLLFQGTGELIGEFYKYFEGKYFGIFVFNEPVLVVKDPDIIKSVLVKDFDVFNDRSSFSDEKIDPLSANFLFLAKYKRWRVLRMKISPIFSSGKLKGMSSQMENIAKDMVQFLQKNTKPNDKYCIMDARELTNRFSMEVLASSAFGMKGECFEKEDAVFYKMGKRIFGYNLLNDARIAGYTINSLFIKLTHLTFLDNHVCKFIRKGISSQIFEREKTNFKRNDLIDLLVDLKKNGTTHGVNFEGDILAAQAGQFFLAGYETVSTTMSFALYEIALNQDIKEKLLSELREVLMEQGKFEYNNVLKMTYLDLVIKETLRKYPLLPYLDRTCNKKYQIPDTDLILEAGTKLYIPLYGLHYDEKYFPDPHRFVPERFSEENKVKFPATVYLPFGLGPRVCIGERYALAAIKIGIAELLTQYDVEPCDDTPIPVEFKKSLTLIPTRTLYLKFKKIETST